MSRPLPPVALAAFAFLLASSALDARADFSAVAFLSGSGERPTSNNSPGIGMATITYEAAKDDILYNVIYSGLLANPTASHIHIGPIDAAGPIVLPFTNMGPPASTSGSFSGRLTNADIINSATTGLTDISQIAAQIQAGNAYVNIHTSVFPAGEIRGQLGRRPRADLAGPDVVGPRRPRRLRPVPTPARPRGGGCLTGPPTRQLFPAKGTFPDGRGRT